MYKPLPKTALGVQPVVRSQSGNAVADGNVQYLTMHMSFKPQKNIWLGVQESGIGNPSGISCQ